MKEEKEKNIKIIAERVYELEQQLKSEHNVSECMNEIEQLIQKLSLEELLAIDDYIISKNNLLTK